MTNRARNFEKYVSIWDFLIPGPILYLKLEGEVLSGQTENKRVKQTWDRKFLLTFDFAP